MRLKIQNIGMIEYADIKLDGLTVIAGENDTGKSTAGKVLYSIVKSISKEYKVSLLSLQNNFNKYFDSDISQNGSAYFQIDRDDLLTLKIDILNNICSFNKEEVETSFFIPENRVSNVLMIETPLVWNLVDLLTKLPMIEDEMNIELQYPHIMKDLHWNLSFKSRENSLNISKTISKIINGEFLKNNAGDFYFQKDNKKIKLINTATGIKYFGILQTLSDNNHLYQGQILILDGPEVHLHPKWQLELAKVIVNLSENGVIILVNSHSPYIIEALEKFSKNKDKNHFYLAENGKIDKVNNSNSDTLAKIFTKLSEPFEEFDKIDSLRLQNG
ncbi:MAG: AAA family ATPase [Sulfurimonas sp.]|nr:AAA family ATPase [Sulfurimonas sp.]